MLNVDGGMGQCIERLHAVPGAQPARISNTLFGTEEVQMSVDRGGAVFHIYP